MPFFKKLEGDPLPITMTGVRAGERLLQLGIDEPALIAALAAKVGMNGTAAHVVTNDADAQRVRRAAEKAGVLIDVKMTGTLRSFPFDDESFDLVVMHSMSGLIAGMAPYTRVRCLEEAHRVLRPGGRIVTIEPEPRGGLAGIFRSHPVDGHYLASGETVGALKAESFKTARILADREGYRFVEGIKG